MMRYHFNPSFLSMILQSIDRGLDPLGPASKKVILWYIEEKKQLSLDQISERATEFVDILKSFLGSGATVLEQRIVQELERTFGLSLNHGSLEQAFSLLKAREKTGQANPTLSEDSDNIQAISRIDSD